MKKCSKCHIEKPLSEFFTSKQSKDGYYPSCKKCKTQKTKEYCSNNKEKIEKYHKEYNKKNKEQISAKKKIYHKLIEEKRKKYYIENKEIISEKKKCYNIENKEKISIKKKIYGILNKDKIKIKNKKWYNDNRNIQLEKQKQYYIENKNKIKEYQKQYNQENKDKINDNKRKYYEKNIHFFIWRKLLKRTLHQYNKKKTDTTYNLLGYTCEQLRYHIEQQFTENMNWLNYGEWHIDHIKPVCTFNSNTHPSIVNDLSNLRPLWATNTEINGRFYEGNLNRKIIKNYV